MAMTDDERKDFLLTVASAPLGVAERQWLNALLSAQKFTLEEQQILRAKFPKDFDQQRQAATGESYETPRKASGGLVQTQHIGVGRYAGSTVFALLLIALNIWWFHHTSTAQSVALLLQQPAAATVSVQDRAVMLQYWGRVQNAVIEAFNDAQSAYADVNDRSMADNYLSNCSTNADSAKAAADNFALPLGWEDVKVALDAGLTDYEAVCSLQGLKLYSGGSAEAGLAAVSVLPGSLHVALRLARAHLRSAGGNPNDIGLP